MSAERSAREGLLEEGLADLPGVHPISQKRSRDLVDRLLASGLELLRSRDFDGLTIDDLCALAGATVGSFYARFANKQAFLLSLQHLVVSETQARIARDFAAGSKPPKSLAPLVEWLCLGTVAWYRRYEGFVRASLRQSGRDPKAWEPLWSLGVLKLDSALPLVASAAGGPVTPVQELELRFAFQMLHGTLNSMLLIDPGPKHLHDKDLPRLLSASLNARLTGVFAPAPAKAGTPRTRRSAQARSG